MCVCRTTVIHVQSVWSCVLFKVIHRSTYTNLFGFPHSRHVASCAEKPANHQDPLFADFVVWQSFVKVRQNLRAEAAILALEPTLQDNVRRTIAARHGAL